MRSIILVGLISLSVSTATLAHAEDAAVREEGALLDRGDHDRPQMLSLFAGLPYYNGAYGGFPAGFGLRYYVPLVRDGFIPAVNDEFGIEFGGDFAAFSYPRGAFYGLSIPIEVLWDFHFFPRLDAYAKVGAAFTFGFGNYYYYQGLAPAPYGVYPITALGLRLRLTDALYLRGEVGFPWTKIGLALAF
ncbi:MAG: hypothetical protein ACYC8T_30165 [Myxococcaceae bacterium]